jgi:hypothetical protein
MLDGPPPVKVKTEGDKKPEIVRPKPPARRRKHVEIPDSDEEIDDVGG